MITCPLCIAESAETVDHLNFSSAKIFYCNGCDYWFTLPMPDDNYLRSYYQNKYRNERVVSLLPEYMKIMKMRAIAQVKFIKSIIGDKITSFKGLDIVDVGCGMGYLLKNFSYEGANIKGYEYDNRIIKLGESRLGVEIINGPFCPTNNKNLDLIVLSHIIEHLNDINLSLKSYRESLKEGGYLFVEVPNSVKEMFEREVDQESHLHFFTKKSLRSILEGNGFEVISCVETGMPIKKAYHFLESKVEIPFHKKCFYKVLKETKFNKYFCLKTIYDGYYENYHFEKKESGQWLRCVAKKI